MLFFGGCRQLGVFSYCSLIFSTAWAVTCSQLCQLSISVAPVWGQIPSSHFEGSVEYLVSSKRLFGGDEK